MQLYRIEYDQLTRISKFDAKGNKIGDFEERVRLSMNDLPLQTAIMYRDKMQGLNFKMTAQTAISDDQPRTYKHDRRSRAASSPVSPAQPTKQQQINQAAATGDMTAAINQRNK